MVITGASRGIGRAIAFGFANEGSRLAICARGSDALERTAEELRAAGVEVHAQVCDVADAKALDAFLDSARSGLGRVDVLVNNASGFGFSDDEGGWSAGFEVDLMAAVRATWRVVPWMQSQSSGAVIHVSSTSALEAGSPPAYAALKAALVSHSKTLAVALGSRGIRVNCVAPGAIEFPGGLWEAIRKRDPERYEMVRASIPSGRLGSPEEVARAVVFLASDAASWITGVTLSIDGGQHKGNL